MFLEPDHYLNLSADLSTPTAMAASKREALELAQLYYAGFMMEQAERAFREAAELCAQTNDSSKYVFCQTKLLRIYSERQDSEKILETISRLNDHASAHLKQSSSVLYALGLCATHQRRYVDASLNFKAAFEIAIEQKNQYDMAYALYGLISVYWVEARHEKALQELKSLRIVTQAVRLSELEFTSFITESLILLDIGRATEALDLLTQVRERILGFRNWYLQHFLMYALAKAYLAVGQRDRAKVYAELASESADPKNFKSLAKHIQNLNTSLRASGFAVCEVYFDPTSSLVVIENEKKVDLKNQFVLLELLQVFTSEPGRVFTKSELIERVWNEAYDPSVHDNKIYVTIKRLRKLIEKDFEKPKYILRAGRGYVFNPSTNLVRVQ